jgi:hypothetical protein
VHTLSLANIFFASAYTMHNRFAILFFLASGIIVKHSVFVLRTFFECGLLRTDFFEQSSSASGCNLCR